MSMENEKQELRCFCSRRPLLGTYGMSYRGELYVHVKIWKQRRLFGEVMVTGGRVQLRCRECLRLHTVVIRQPNRAVLKEISDPLPS